MFPFQRSCELSFKISDEGVQNEQTSLEDQIMLENNSSFGFNNSSSSINSGRGRGRGRGRRLSSSLVGISSNNNNIVFNNEIERRNLHRENERQRRQQMADLFNSLNATLPAELIQGSRSVSDHVGEAINYIQNLKKNVKELEERRDLLKQSVESPSSRVELGESSNAGLEGSCVVIKECVVGLEIEISVGFEDENFLLSSALQLAFDEGLEVVSCTSTKFNMRKVHILQCQIRNTACVDVNRLQQRFNDLVS